MKPSDIAKEVEALLQRSIENVRYTGRVVIHIDCTQGHIRPPKVILTDTRKIVSIIDYRDLKGGISDEKG